MTAQVEAGAFFAPAQAWETVR